MRLEGIPAETTQSGQEYEEMNKGREDVHTFTWVITRGKMRSTLHVKTRHARCCAGILQSIMFNSYVERYSKLTLMKDLV